MPSAYAVAKTHTNKIAKWLSGSSSDNICLDGINDVPYIIISDVWTGRQTHTYLEDCFRHTIHVSRSILVARLLVHGLPNWPCFYLSLIKSNTHSFYVSIGFTISMSRFCSMDNTCCTNIQAYLHARKSISSFPHFHYSLLIPHYSFGDVHELPVH